MATRGTYQIDGNPMLYNHWDNYPSGTAVHLAEVIKAHGKLDYFSVIRGMPKTDPIDSPFNCGAEFHYVIKGGRIECYAIPYCENGENKLLLQSSDTIENWLNANIELGAEDVPADWKILKIHNGYYMTETQAREKAKREWRHAVEAFEKGWTGNASSAFNSLFQFTRTAGIHFPEMLAEYISKYSPAFAKAYGHETTSLFDSYALGEKAVCLGGVVV